MSKLEKYPSYKDSGVEWLGEIPVGWELTKLGTKFIERKEKVSDKDYEPLSITKNGVIPQLDSAAKSNDGDNRKLVKKGDFVINSRSDRKGSSGVSSIDGSVSLIYIVLEPIGINPVFCNYLLKSNGFIEEFYRNGHGIVADLWTTRFWDMKSIMLGIPPKQEQIKIASFLDEKTEQLDKAIQQKEQLIKLLKERRQILINDAVTKGLDRTVAMKDSGVEWIGEIPEGWDLMKTTHVFKNIGSGTTPTSSDTKYYDNGEINWLQTGDLTDGLILKTNKKITKKALKDFSVLKIYPKNSLVIAMYGATIGKAGLLQIDTATNQACCVLSGSNHILETYAFYWFLSSKNDIISMGYGGGQPNISQDLIKSLKLTVPPTREEQNEIVNYIEENNQKIDKAINLQQQQITKLKEYKASLIDSVVTGKVRVA